jgi:hypothetical protein
MRDDINTMSFARHSAMICALAHHSRAARSIYVINAGGALAVTVMVKVTVADYHGVSDSGSGGPEIMF